MIQNTTATHPIQIRSLQQSSGAPMSELSAESSNEQHTDIFDKDHDHVLEEFGQLCEQVGIDTAIAIIKDKNTGKPIVFIRGHLYDAGCMTTKVLQEIKTDLLRGLNLLVIVVGHFLL